MKEVQSFITNISFPKTLDELLYFLEDDFHFNVDDILEYEYVEWTAPRWCKIGDIVFFMHSKTAKSIITKLRTQYQKNKHLYTNNQCKLIEKGIEHALDNYKKYGGKIYAIGRVSNPSFYDSLSDDDIKFHWGSKIYAPINEIIVLKNPIHISEFNNYIYISRQSAITPVFGKEFLKLKELIISKNKTSEYFKNSISTVFPIREINKTNWLNISNDYRRSFFLEQQFRSYYTDYLLKLLSDNHVYRECACKTKNLPDCFIDNIIIFNKKYLKIEIKLNINIEKNLKQQMNKYCNCDKIILNKEINKFYKNNDFFKSYKEKALIIDTNNIYIFNNLNNHIIPIFKLDNLKTYNDIEIIKNKIKQYI